MTPDDPHEDVTPVRSSVPDHDWFPCVYCGRMNRCPPVAKPVSKYTTALIHREDGIVAPELNPPAADTTKIQAARTRPPAK